MDELNTPEKIMEYLDGENIDYSPEQPEGFLYALAKRRVKRRLYEGGDLSVKRTSNINIGIARSLDELLATIARLRQKADASGREEKTWPTVRFTIEDIPAEVVKLKHQVQDNDMCKGHVVDGECVRCHALVPGILAYSFSILAQDENNPACKLSMKVSDKGGKALFQQDARTFNALPGIHKADALEAIEAIPVAAKLIMTYDPDQDDLFVCAFDFAIIRND
jgi:hypothetical protein